MRMIKYHNKYRIPSARLENWDYGANGAYFITICIKDRLHYFGEVANNNMLMNEAGQLAMQYWVEIPKHFSYVELGNFIIMPNHIHGILIINKTADYVREDNSYVVVDAPPKTGGFAGDNSPMLNDNISRILRWYKGRSAFEIHKINNQFNWQPRFHDHIIRNAQSFEIIQNYIETNPQNWGKDKFYS